MYSLANSSLRIEVIDPMVDKNRLGPRYVWGGYIWQVYDVEHDQPLVTGPEWPEKNPSAFNGQGLPESFRHRTRDGRDLTWAGETGVALGAGELRTGANGVEVVRPCLWKVEEREHQIIFETTQQAAGCNYRLIREIELRGRTTRSLTTLTNLADSPLNLEWFAHPFFALSHGVVEAKILSRADIAENPGFVLDNGNFRQKRKFIGTNDGHMDAMKLAGGEKLRLTVAHPTLTGLTFSTSFVPSDCVIWGNGNTFSFEPYRTISLAPGATDAWSLSYDFGASSGTSSPGDKVRTPDAR